MTLTSFITRWQTSAAAERANRHHARETEFLRKKLGFYPP